MTNSLSNADLAHSQDRPVWLAAGSLPEGLLQHQLTPPSPLVEVFIDSKGPGYGCEDRVVVGPHHVAVLDGMSSPLRSPNERGSGAIFAQRAGEAILDLPADISAREAIDRVSQGLQGIDSGHAGPSGTVAAIYSMARHEVWRVGDIHVSIAGKSYPAGKLVDTAMTMFRAAINAAYMADGVPESAIMDDDLGLDAAAPLLRVQQSLANRGGPFGYGVLNGTNVPDEFLEVYPVPRGAEVVLASDGFLSPAAGLRQAEEELQHAILADPSCVNELRDMGKALRAGMDAPDDRSYIRLAGWRDAAAPHNTQEREVSA